MDSNLWAAYGLKIYTILRKYRFGLEFCQLVETLISTKNCLITMC